MWVLTCHFQHYIFKTSHIRLCLVTTYILYQCPCPVTLDHFFLSERLILVGDKYFIPRRIYGIQVGAARRIYITAVLPKYNQGHCVYSFELFSFHGSTLTWQWMWLVDLNGGCLAGLSKFLSCGTFVMWWFCSHAVIHRDTGTYLSISKYEFIVVVSKSGRFAFFSYSSWEYEFYFPLMKKGPKRKHPFFFYSDGECSMVAYTVHHTQIPKFF